MVAVINEIKVCVNCAELIANGELTHPVTGEDMAEEHGNKMARLWSHAGNMVLACGEDDDCGFSWSACEGCGSPLGGDRHSVSVFA